MHLNLRMEQFGFAYIRAVAAVAGYQVMRPEVDDDSVDGCFKSRGGQRPQIDFQAKATALSQFPADSEEFSFDLKIKNYNDLCAETIIPRILIVVVMPKDESEWLSQNENELILRRCGYWLSLRNMPSYANKASIRVKLPRTQMLLPESLRLLMEKANQRETP